MLRGAFDTASPRAQSAAMRRDAFRFQSWRLSPCRFPMIPGSLRIPLSTPNVITRWVSSPYSGITCERMLFLIFCFIFKFTPRFGWIVAHDIGDLSLSERIRELLKVQPLENEEQELILNLLDVYDACRQNRNTLTHFTVSPGSSGPTADTEFKFLRLKGPSPTPKEFPSKLEDIRAVAFEIKTLSLYMSNIRMALIEREADLPAPRPLPPKVAVPALLSLPLSQADKAPQPQRPPSVLRLTEEEWIAKCRKEGRPFPEKEGG